MNSILSIYLVCTLICIALNHKFYKKALSKNGKQKTCRLIIYVMFVFLGPFSLALTILSLIYTIYCKIKNYIKIRRFKKELREELKKMIPQISDELEKACKKCGITVVD